ncbi:hypothetical protein [Agromyces sp. Leaf222]|uniref:hypothetical protein n=1 Tax=Agromyces sp. Leaf222 TaxID=1735688 RepID=UPI0006FEB233|nr:hypothetical protein [Agromyces sp. Leaf222]KQM82418.1 hypothetical protein ASE68_03220 [Agromyces sp. Leaf222]
MASDEFDPTTAPAYIEGSAGPRRKPKLVEEFDPTTAPAYIQGAETAAAAPKTPQPVDDFDPTTALAYRQGAAAYAARSTVPEPTDKRGAWHVYRPGYLALYGIPSAMIILWILLNWGYGVAVIPGLLGILFFVMTGRQLYLKGQPTRR